MITLKNTSVQPQPLKKRLQPSSDSYYDYKETVGKRPPYLCPELGRTCTRPGAYDAFDLPSVYAGVRLPYRFSQGLPETAILVDNDQGETL